MTRVEPHRAPCPDEIEVLTLHLGGVRMAADVAQVLEMLDLDRAPADDLASALPTGASRNSGSPSGFQAPKLLVLRGQGERRIVTIDRPGDILTLPVGSIQPMPELVAACTGTRPFWGAVILDGSPLLLVDLDELVPR